MKTDAPTLVRVTDRNIRRGLPGDCHRCAVSRALIVATGDDEAHVIEREWTVYLVVHDCYLVAPRAVAAFVHAYDGLNRDGYGNAKLPREPDARLAPFDFELPPYDSPEWEEECYGCQNLFAPSELDDEGYCRGCGQEAPR